jgi:hypothetical protein
MSSKLNLCIPHDHDVEASDHAGVSIGRNASFAFEEASTTAGQAAQNAVQPDPTNLQPADIRADVPRNFFSAIPKLAEGGQVQAGGHPGPSSIWRPEFRPERPN